MPGRRSLGVINASENDLSVLAERGEFQESEKREKFSGLKSFLFAILVPAAVSQSFDWKNWKLFPLMLCACLLANKMGKWILV